MAQPKHIGYDEEAAAAILLPHFDAVRDVFMEHELADGTHLTELKRTKFIVDENWHKLARISASERNFAACRVDGSLIYFDPQIVQLPHETVVAIIAHEFGHAADFCYPGHWMTPLDGDRKPARWVGKPTTSSLHGWRRVWEDRNADQVEWAADSIAFAVTGKKIGYCGPCMLQCFSGKPRPKGLR